jgi:hypothetical protein
MVYSVRRSGMKLQNKIFAAVISGAVLASGIVGCDDPNARAVKPTTKPSTAVEASPQADPNAVTAAYPMKPPSIISIDGRDVPFPAAKLAVIGHGSGGFTLRLCSDDPPTAIDPGYAGNSYLLDMQIPIDRLRDLPGARWEYKPGEGDDSTAGIFLHGFRDQLHPQDLHVMFMKDSDQGKEIEISLTGTYLKNDAKNPAAPPERVTVNAFLHVPQPSEQASQ